MTEDRILKPIIKHNGYCLFDFQVAPSDPKGGTDHIWLNKNEMRQMRVEIDKILNE